MHSYPWRRTLFLWLCVFAYSSAQCFRPAHLQCACAVVPGRGSRPLRWVTLPSAALQSSRGRKERGRASGPEWRTASTGKFRGSPRGPLRLPARLLLSVGNGRCSPDATVSTAGDDWCWPGTAGCSCSHSGSSSAQAASSSSSSESHGWWLGWVGTGWATRKSQYGMYSGYGTWARKRKRDRCKPDPWALGRKRDRIQCAKARGETFESVCVVVSACMRVGYNSLREWRG